MLVKPFCYPREGKMKNQAMRDIVHGYIHAFPWKKGFGIACFKYEIFSLFACSRKSVQRGAL
jgi:hypothetical protein